ncbi:MAG: hypothetical protein HZA79_05005 [Sphingobacteriales bacterium]|nr:hypothetical protein [Sphingobacteriales bacterium]
MAKKKVPPTLDLSAENARTLIADWHKGVGDSFPNKPFPGQVEFMSVLNRIETIEASTNFINLCIDAYIEKIWNPRIHDLKQRLSTYKTKRGMAEMLNEELSEFKTEYNIVLGLTFAKDLFITDGYQARLSRRSRNGIIGCTIQDIRKGIKTKVEGIAWGEFHRNMEEEIQRLLEELENSSLDSFLGNIHMPGNAETKNQPQPTYKKIALFVTFMNEETFSEHPQFKKRNRTHAEYCKNICKLFGLPYSDKVRQQFNDRNVNFDDDQLREILFDVIPFTTTTTQLIEVVADALKKRIMVKHKSSK